MVSIGSVGAEMAALVEGHDAVDLHFTWYGQALDPSFFLNSLGYVPANRPSRLRPFKLRFSGRLFHELYHGGPDLRLSVTGYKFDTGSGVYGYYAGAELKSRNGVFVVKYDVGHDNVNQAYQAVGAFANIGFQLENLLSGKSPFVMPSRCSKALGILTTLTEAKANRNWRRTTQDGRNSSTSPTKYP